MSTTIDTITTRKDIVLLVEVRDGNPNGDPDMGNAPRQDPSTGHGFITDVAVKRVVRDFIKDIAGDEQGYRIFVSDGAVLERSQQEAFEAVGAKEGEKDKAKERQNDAAARQWLCRNFFDVRAFGAVLAGKKFAASAVNGPVQVTFGRSVDPITYDEVTITRCAVTSEKDEDKERTMGRKHIVPYALYRIEVRLSPYRAMGPNGSGFSQADAAVLEKALLEGFGHRRTASKGHMETRAMFVFDHESALGDAPAYELFERVTAVKKVEHPRAYADYDVVVRDADLPRGVTLRRVR